jgi:hypothetical protein
MNNNDKSLKKPGLQLCEMCTRNKCVIMYSITETFGNGREKKIIENTIIITEA